MKTEYLRPKAGFFEQLALGMELGEDERDASGFVSPEEARRRSDVARRILTSKMAATMALSAVGQEVDHPGWFEQYQQLLDEKWPWHLACYIAWAASPKRGRWPETQAQLAMEVLGLTGPRQIHTWRKKYPEIDEVISVMQAAPLLEHRADVLRALAEAASDKDHRNNPDRKLYLEMTGDYVPRQKVDLVRGEVDDLSELDEAELARMARVIKKKSFATEITEGDEEGKEAGMETRPTGEED